MTKYSRELIFLQSENARIKLKEIAQSLKKSPQRLKYSIKALLREGVLKEPHCVFDYSYFGLILFRVYFKGGYISERDKGNIIMQLGENPYVVAIYELGGEFDLAIEIESKNPSRFNKELKRVADLIPTLNNYKVLLNVVTHFYPRNYLIRNTEQILPLDTEIIVGGDREVHQFSDKDIAVMRVLHSKPRIRLTRLAKEAGMNIKTAGSVLKGLKEKKAIRGFRYIIDNNKMGISRFRLFLKLHNLTQERDSQLLNYLMKTNEIISANRTIGDWNMEVDIESFDKSGIRQIIAEFREQFKDIIESFNLIEFFGYYKKSYLPVYLFTEQKQTDDKVVVIKA